MEGRWRDTIDDLLKATQLVRNRPGLAHPKAFACAFPTGGLDAANGKHPCELFLLLPLVQKGGFHM